MKKIYLTFDIEPIVSRLSFNPTVYNNVVLGGLRIANDLKERGLKGTFYISLSKKSKSINSKEYYDGLDILLTALKGYPNISVQPHLHGFNLPVSFNTPKDQFETYNLEEQVELLSWAKDFLGSYGYEVNSFRPGSYSKNFHYYTALERAGYKISSTLIREKPSIDLNKKVILENQNIFKEGNIIEYPVTALKIKNIRGKEEIVNLSPDFFTLESIKFIFEKLDYLNINYHSFSVFANRLARENHKNMLSNNIFYYAFEKPVNWFFSKFEWEIVNKKTIFSNELGVWLDHIVENSYSTYFIGE
jgi:hypothetical protein